MCQSLCIFEPVTDEGNLGTQGKPLTNPKGLGAHVMPRLVLGRSSIIIDNRSLASLLLLIDYETGNR